MQALSVRLSEQEGRAQTKLEKTRHFLLIAGKQQRSQSNKQLNDVR